MGDTSEGEIYEEYLRWKQKRVFNSSKTENYSFKENFLSKSLSAKVDHEENQKEDEILMRNDRGKSEERRISLEISSDEITLKEFLNNEERQWEKVKHNMEKDIKIKHLFLKFS